MNAQVAIMVPRPDGTSVALDMGEIYQAEARVKEVAIVNAHKAPELLAVFNMAFLTLNDHLRKLEMCLNEADKKARQIRSVIILDKVPEILKAKGLASARSPGGSEDQRQAVLDADADYTAARDRVELIRCMIELLKGKRQAFEMAYTSIKKLLSEGPSAGGLGMNRSLSAGETPASATAGQNVGRSHPAFGGAK